MPRPRRTAAILCIAVALFAAFSPGIAGLYWAILDPGWSLLPPERVVVRHSWPARVHQQTRSLLSLASSRAPPSAAALA